MVQQIDSLAINLPTYDSTVDEYDVKTHKLESAELEARRKFMNLTEKGRILDVACGTGRDARIFLDHGFSVVGIDASAKMITKAKRRAPEATFYTMDMRKLLFTDIFDGAFCSGAIVCIEKRNAATVLRELYALLRPQGTLFVNVKEGDHEGSEMDQRYGKEKYFSYYRKEEIESVVRKSGFDILESYTPELSSSYHQHPWIYIFARKS